MNLQSTLRSLVAGLPVVASLLLLDPASADSPSFDAAFTASRHAARPVDGSAGEWLMTNPANGLEAKFDGSGMSMQVKAKRDLDPVDAQSLTWEMSGVGYGSEVAPVGEGVLNVDSSYNSRLEIRRSGIVEWFINQSAGLEHGYTLQERPEGGGKGDALRLEMRVEGDLSPNVSPDGQQVTLVDLEGRGTLRYNKLKAWDATGRILKARMVGSNHGLAFEVEDSEAIYPVTIDPLFTQTDYLKASNTAEYDLFGSAVAVDGDTVVVGAPEEDNVNIDSGAVYVFKRNGVNWSEQAYLKASNAQVGNKFGSSVAISGDTIVVGAPFENGGGSSAGAAYVFQRSGNSWNQQAFLKATIIDAGDRFGSSVSISGNTVLVGAPGEDSSSTVINSSATNNGAADAGAAYVFFRSGSSWSQQAYLKAANSETSDAFGRSVSLSGDSAVVGAEFESGSAVGSNGPVDNLKGGSGAAYVFLRNGTSWSQQAYLKASNTDVGDRFGAAVSISGETLAVGAHQEDGYSMDVNGDDSLNGPPGSIGSESGAAYVFVRSGSTWSQQAYVKAPNPSEIDFFGQTLCVSGDVLVVGAANESSNATGINGNGANDDFPSSGAAYVYLRDGVTWTREAYLKASNAQALDYFGTSVAVSGATIVVGAPREDSAATGINGNESDDGATESGAVYLFLGEGDGFGVRELWGAGPELSSNELGDLPEEQDGVNASSTAWSYGTRSSFLGTSLTVYTPAEHQNGIGHPDVDGWAPGTAVLVNRGVGPAIVNLSGETTIPVLSGQIIVKPTSGLYPVVRWTAPEKGTYNFAARWVDLDDTTGNGAAAHVVINGKEIYGGLSPYSPTEEPVFTGLAWDNGLGAAMPPQSYPLEAGATVDFVVGPNGDASGDLTAFNAVVCRAPDVTISAPVTIVSGAPLNVAVTVGPGTELLGASLRVDGEPVSTDLTAPFGFTLSSLTPGDHHLQVEAINTGRVLGASNVALVTVESPPPAGAPLIAFKSLAAGSSATGSVYDALTSGFWDQPDIWKRRGDNAQGVPGPNDVAVLDRSVQIVLRDDVTVAKVYCEGRIRGDDPANNRQFTVTEHFSIYGLVADLTLNNPEGGLITNVKGAAFFENVNVLNNGRMYLTRSLYSTDSDLTSNGELTLVNPPASGGPIRAGFDSATLGGIYNVGPGAAIAAQHLISNGAGILLPTFGPGLIGLDGSTLIGNDGSTLIGNDGSTLVGNDGASLVGNDGASLIGNDSAGLIGNDSAGLIGNDSAGLISDNGAILVGNDGASLAQTAAAGVISNGSSGFTGGTLNGSGNLVGTIVNSGATLRPGNSPGMFYVSGDFTQDSGGTLALEIGGTNIEKPREFDQLVISGQATLGGELIVNTINGYQPKAGESVLALYFGSRTGTFSRVSSNANIAFGPNGMTLGVNPTLSPPPAKVPPTALINKLKKLTKQLKKYNKAGKKAQAKSLKKEIKQLKIQIAALS